MHVYCVNMNLICEHIFRYIFFLQTYPYIAQATCNPLSLYSFGVRRLLTTSKQNITLLPVVVVYTNDNMNDTHTHTHGRVRMLLHFEYIVHSNNVDFILFACVGNSFQLYTYIHK